MPGLQIAKPMQRKPPTMMEQIASEAVEEEEVKRPKLRMDSYNIYEDQFLVLRELSIKYRRSKSEIVRRMFDQALGIKRTLTVRSRFMGQPKSQEGNHRPGLRKLSIAK